MPRLLAIGLVLVAWVALTPAAARAEDWTIRQVRAEYIIERDATVRVVEFIEVDFQTLPSHGIFRDLTSDIPCSAFLSATEETAPCPEGFNRHYDYSDFDVRSAKAGAEFAPVPWERLGEHHTVRLKIGDPDRLITGVHRYRIAYTITGALDPLGDRDQFFWNVSGVWETTIAGTEVSVRSAAGSPPALIECYEGSPLSSRACTILDGPPIAFRTGSLTPGNELTVRLAWPKGVLAVPPPLYSQDPSWRDFFTFDAFELVVAGLLSLLAVVGAFFAWLANGRDLRYTTIHYLTGDAAQKTRGLFEGDDVVVEYTPPEGRRPAQLAAVINEEVRPRDVTATIVDLAVRGYLRITEEKEVRSLLPDQTDWNLERLKPNEDGLLKYEAMTLNALFQGRKGEVAISQLRQKFADRMKRIKENIVKDAVANGWFARAPGTVRGMWLAGGLVLAAAGVGVGVLAGLVLERALLGLPVVVLGLGVAAASSAMPRRTAAGSEARRRALGFRLYVSTAETRLHEFNEQRNLFAAYLPYAIAFDCVDRWASAFEGLADEAAEATSGWYHGTAPFSAVAFASGMDRFSSEVASSLAQSASSSGSGVGSFGGGGGGGGGGGRW